MRKIILYLLLIVAFLGFLAKPAYAVVKTSPTASPSASPTFEPTPLPTPVPDLTQKTQETLGPLEKLLEEQKLGPVWPSNPLKHAIRGAVETGVPANTIVLLLLLPLVATIIAAARHLVGLRGFGIFLPAALSVVFVATRPVVGIGLFLIIVTVSTLTRMLLRRRKIMKASLILGLNARTQLFTYRYNSLQGKKIADSKLQTARVLGKTEVTLPKIYKKFKNPEDIEKFDWESLPNSFAVKPSRGLGGEGIIVVKKKIKDGEGWITTQRERVTVDDLKFHVLDILEGAFSMRNEPDVAFIQEYVGRHKAFKKYAYRGTPDIRIIVFNKVPVMAMLRLPTKESGGRANLHQGAVGVGIDIATGITTKAIWHGEQIVYKPGTGKKLRGIKIPNWTLILETAVKAQIASGMGYLGVDIVLHPEKGPMVLELNAQPGLQIQLANMEGLKKRLERIEDIDVI